MIYLLCEQTPSSLLYIEEIDAPATLLIQKSLAHLKEGDFRGAEARAQEALAVARQGRNPLEQAMASLCLSDIYRNTNRLGPALQMALQAYEGFQRLSSLVQRYNEGIAAYNLGLIHHLMGESAKALNWYATARQRLVRAKGYWSGRRMESLARRCEYVEACITRLSEILTAPERRPEDPTAVILVVSDDDIPTVTEIGIEGFRPGGNLWVDGRTVQVIAPSDQVTLILDQNCRIFRIPEDVPDDVCARIGVQRGDYALARREEDPQIGVIYIAKTGTDTDFVEFYRDTNGRVNGKSVTGRILGGFGPSDLPTYRPLAFLRPTG